MAMMIDSPGPIPAQAKPGPKVEERDRHARTDAVADTGFPVLLPHRGDGPASGGDAHGPRKAAGVSLPRGPAGPEIRIPTGGYPVLNSRGEAPLVKAAALETKPATTAQPVVETAAALRTAADDGLRITRQPLYEAAGAPGGRGKAASGSPPRTASEASSQAAAVRGRQAYAPPVDVAATRPVRVADRDEDARPPAPCGDEPAPLPAETGDAASSAVPTADLVPPALPPAPDPVAQSATTAAATVPVAGRMSPHPARAGVAAAGPRPAVRDQGSEIRLQVARFVNTRLEGLTGGEKVVLRLNPGHLGRIELHFDVRGDRLAVTLSARTTDAEAALQENTRDLADRIVERASRFSHVDVRVEVKGGGDQRSDVRQDQKQDERQDQRREQSSQGGHDGDGDHGRGAHDRRDHAHRTRQARHHWESVMNWELSGDDAGEKG